MSLLDEQSRTRRLVNPFRPGAGHTPPYLAGREVEKKAFEELLPQDIVLRNLIVTGLRGVGKTVLLEEFKPLAYRQKWFWVGTDLSESASVSEETVVRRLLADLSTITAGVSMDKVSPPAGISLMALLGVTQLSYQTLMQLYESQPGLAADKLKSVLEFAWSCLDANNARGVIFAYDEAQTMSDHAEQDEFPLSLLLDVFQSIQRKGIRFMLVLAGLPTLFPKLVATRTYAERMFSVMTLDRLNPVDSKAAIVLPIRKEKDCPVYFSEKAIANIVEASEGYPYFIQFICKEAFDIYAQQWAIGAKLAVPLLNIFKKLDRDFFSARWARATDRQKDLLTIIARLKNSNSEFTVQDIVNEARVGRQKFSASHVNQMLVTLGNVGLIYKNGHGRYSFAVPLLADFIRRQEAEVQGKQLTLPIGEPFE